MHLSAFRVLRPSSLAVVVAALAAIPGALAQAGEQGATAPATKAPPAPSELALDRTIDRDPDAGGLMEGGPHALAFSPDGTMLAVGGQEGSVSIVDLAGEGAPVRRRLAQHEGAVAGVAFVKRGARGLLASVGDDGVVIVAPVDSGTSASRGDPILRRPLALGPLTALAVLDAGPESPRLVAGSARGGLAVLAVADSISLEKTLDLGAAHETTIAGLAALGRERFALAGWDGFVRVIDGASGKVLRAAKLSSVELTAIAATTDAKALAVASWKKGVALLDARSLEPLAPAVEPHEGATNALALAGTGSSHRGLRLVSASIADETVVVSDAWGERLVTVRRSKVKGVASALALSPDGRELAVASFDGTIALYKLEPRAGGDAKSDAKGEGK